MQSKVDIRKFSVEQAVAIMGTGTPQKDIVAKAQEIERYIVGDADIPEIDNEKEFINSVMSDAFRMFSGTCADNPLDGINGQRVISEKKK